MGCKLAPAAKSCVGWVYVRRCAYKHFSLSFCVTRVSSIPSLSRSAARRSASKYNSGSRLAGALFQIPIPHSIHRAEHIHQVYAQGCCRIFNPFNAWVGNVCGPALRCATAFLFWTETCPSHSLLSRFSAPEGCAPCSMGCSRGFNRQGN